MVACQNTEAAGIIWDRFVKAELGREIRDRSFNGRPRPRFSISVLARKIIPESVVHLL